MTDADAVRPLSDADLLEFIAAVEDDATLARECWKEFYTRHSSYLYKAVKGRFLQPYGSSFVEDVVADTFFRVRQKAATYRQDAHETSARVRAWLGRIAVNIAYDKLRRPARRMLVLKDESFWQAQEVVPHLDDEAPRSRQVSAASAAWDRLSLKEREVLLATIDNYGPDGTRYPMTSEDVAALATNLGVGTATIRQIRRRAMTKFKQLVEEAMRRCAQ